MNTLVPPTKIQGTTLPLDQLLDKLKVYGLPAVSMVDASGWYCRVKMNTNTVGTAFEVNSDFKNPTAAAAAQQCLERILAALQKLEVRS